MRNLLSFLLLVATTSFLPSVASAQARVPIALLRGPGAVVAFPSRVNQPALAQGAVPARLGPAAPWLRANSSASSFPRLHLGTLALLRDLPVAFEARLPARGLPVRVGVGFRF